MSRWAWWMSILCFCGKNGGDTAAGDVSSPEVSGRYNVVVSWVTGCDGDPAWVQDWAEGPLEVDSLDAGISLDFGDDMVFDGNIDALGEIQFSGKGVWADADLDIQGSGQFAEEEATSGEMRWVLSAELQMVKDDDGLEVTNCTLDSALEAYELVDLE